jgi:hypothetical protein
MIGSTTRPLKPRLDYDEEINISEDLDEIIEQPVETNPKRQIEMFLEEMREKHQFDRIYNEFKNAITISTLERIPKFSQFELEAVCSLIDHLPLSESVELLAALCSIGNATPIPALHSIVMIYLKKANPSFNH